MTASRAERVSLVVEHLRAEGMEPSDDGSIEGSLEHMAEGLIDALEVLDRLRRISDPRSLARNEELLTELRKELLVERARVGHDCFDVGDVIPIVKPLLDTVRAEAAFADQEQLLLAEAVCEACQEVRDQELGVLHELVLAHLVTWELFVGKRVAEAFMNLRALRARKGIGE